VRADNLYLGKIETYIYSTHLNLQRFVNVYPVSSHHFLTKAACLFCQYTLKGNPMSDALFSSLRTLDIQMAGLEALRVLLQEKTGENFTRCVDAIATRYEKTRDGEGSDRRGGDGRGGDGRVIVTGMGKSGHIGRKIAATLASTGTPAYFVHPGEASHGDLGMIRESDVILALSWSGETAELADIIAYARRFRVLLVAITCAPHSALGQAADFCLTLPRADEACPNGLAPTTSTTMQLVLGDALAIALLEKRGFSAQDFREFHPGGKLGARLRQVRDVMHQGESLPLVEENTPMAQALLVQSQKGFGCVIVVNQHGLLCGIITDGDLRRHMDDGLLRKPAHAIMTPSPLTIHPDMLLVDALEQIETRKRSALIVTENQRPIGLLHVLDLLRAGLV
jgi:arabinose-5-phosphate isomerase